MLLLGCDLAHYFALSKVKLQVCVVLNGFDGTENTVFYRETRVFGQRLIALKLARIIV